MRKQDKQYNEKVEKYLLTLIELCLTDGTPDARAYNKKYIHGCRREGFFALKIVDTIIEKWSGTGVTPYRVDDQFMELVARYRDQDGDKAYIEIEHEDFLATVEIVITGGTSGNYISGVWTPHRVFIPYKNGEGPKLKPIRFKATYVDFVGDLDALESQALLASLSHDFD